MADPTPPPTNPDPDADERLVDFFSKYGSALRAEIKRNSWGSDRNGITDEVMSHLQEKLLVRYRERGVPDSEMKFAITAIKHYLIDLYRKQQTQEASREGWTAQQIANQEKAIPAWLEAAMEDCVARLPELNRRVFELTRLGMPNKDIAALLGKKAPRTAEVKVPTMKMLSDCLEDKAGEW